MDIGLIKTEDLRTYAIARKMGLIDIEPEEILKKWATPLSFRSEARRSGHSCTYRQAELILTGAGWQRPEGYSDSAALPLRSRRKDWYSTGEMVPISKYFSAPAGSRIARTYKRVRYTATVTNTGRLLADDFNADPLSPTGWARLVMDRPGKIAIMPQVFWPKAEVVEEEAVLEPTPLTEE